MKRYLILIISAAFFWCAEAQQPHGSFSIFGVIKGFSNGKAVLSFIQNNTNRHITTAVEKGQFHFSGQLPEIERVTIDFSNNNYNGSVNFFAGNEKIKLFADTALLFRPRVEGSVSEKIFEEYQLKVEPIEKKSALLNEYGKRLFLSGEMTELEKDSLFKVHDDLDREKKLQITGFAKQYPSSAVSAWAISVFFAYDPKLNELEPAYNSLSKNIRQSLYGKQVSEIIEVAKKTAIGRIAADFKINDVNGNPVSLFSYKGKFVLVDFWASWCGPCRAENPNLLNVYQKYSGSGFDILSISLDADKAAWLNAISHDRLSWAQLSDLKGWDSKVVSEYGLKGIPFNMLLDKAGKIIAKNLRGTELEKRLKEILN